MSLLPILAAAIPGVVSAISAERQMRFQERMSSTAVQRSVTDAMRAGVHPSVVAGRGASTPGGAEVNAGDPVGSFWSARSAREQVGLLHEQKLMAQQQRLAHAAIDPAERAAWERLSFLSELNLQGSQADVNSANAVLSTLGASRAQREAEMYRGPAGRVLPYINSAGQVLRMIRDVAPIGR